MELKCRYKKTDVGIIPEDWDIFVLGDLTSKVGSGITPTGGSRVYKTDGRPFVRSQNVGMGKLILDDMAFIDEVIHNSFRGTEIACNDVLLNITGASIGRSAIADFRIERGNVNQHVCLIRPISSRLSPHYLNCFLASREGQAQIDSFQAGGNRQGLNFAQIRSFILPVPSTLAEQEAIAGALSDADALIESLERLIAKKRDIKQGAMQQLLTGKKRLAGFEMKRGYQQTDVGLIPEDWASAKIGDVATCYSGGTPNTSRSEYYGGDIPWITSTDLNKTRIKDVAGRITTSGLANSSAKLVKQGTLLLALYGATAGVCAITEISAAINQAVLAISSNDCNVEYLYQYLHLKKNEFISTFTQGGQPNLSGAIVKSFVVPLPSSRDEQNAIAAALSDIDNEVSGLETRLEKTRFIKQAMMQELLTGKTRLVSAEVAHV
jgi:type I restriction enzyme S subunit